MGVLDDSLDDGTPSVNSDIVSCSSPIPSAISSGLSSRKKSSQPKSSKVTGYILYSSGVRRGIRKKNPEATFGDISRMVGNEWKNLSSSIRQTWEDKAGKVNEENAKIYLEEMANCASPVPPEPNQVWSIFIISRFKKFISVCVLCSSCSNACGTSVIFNLKIQLIVLNIA